ncbi:SH3 domain-containing protein [Moellerella wisconsensis]|uniref:SH3 domain-containing protein n=1 Tax=Moellerella wisconsensis TaxID=158849 RepID=A0A9Q8Q1P2_9GAMM|nr:SH3 domain-containing protein [Moellerella wisconsensis]UNH30835.1 SH3 domain-containing protein [Moellerella wisconsensis]
MSDIEKLLDSSLFKTIKSLRKQTTPLMAIVNQTSKMIPESLKQMQKVFPQQAAIEAAQKYSRSCNIIDFTWVASPVYQSAISSANSIASQIKLLESSWQLGQMVKGIFPLLKPLELGLSDHQLLESISKNYNLESIGIISKLKNSPLTKDYVYHEHDIEDVSIHYDDFYGLDNAIVAEVCGETDFFRLPPRLKQLIYYIIDKLVLPLVIGLISGYILSQYLQVQQDFTVLTSKAEVRQQARKMTSLYDKEVLKGLRVIIGNNVQLRTEPSMKSSVITLLDIGKIVRIVDKSDKVWLLVEIEEEDEFIQGWVSRRYTQHFN